MMMSWMTASGEISSELSGRDDEVERGEKSRGVVEAEMSWALLTSLAMLLRSLNELLACKLLVTLSVFTVSMSAMLLTLFGLVPMSLLNVQLFL